MKLETFIDIIVVAVLFIIMNSSQVARYYKNTGTYTTNTDLFVFINSIIVSIDYRCSNNGGIHSCMLTMD